MRAQATFQLTGARCEDLAEESEVWCYHSLTFSPGDMTSKSLLSCMGVSHGSRTVAPKLEIQSPWGEANWHSGLTGGWKGNTLYVLQYRYPGDRWCQAMWWAREGREEGTYSIHGGLSSQCHIISKISLWYHQSQWNLSSVKWHNTIISNLYSTLHAYMVSADDKHRTGWWGNLNECSLLAHHQGKPGCWMCCLTEW